MARKRTAAELIELADKHRWIDDVQRWCRHHRVPYVHGCLWDRQCRILGGAPARITLHVGRWMVWWDLPTYQRFPCDPKRSWCWGGWGRHRSVD